MMATIEHQQPRSASDNLILGVVAAYAAAFVVFGFLVQPAADVLRGLKRDPDHPRRAAHRLFRRRRNRRGLRERRAADPCSGARLLARWREDDGRVRRGALSRAGLRPVRQEPSQCLADRRGRCALRAVPRRAFPRASQYGVLRRRARADFFGDPVLHRPHADGQRSTCARDRACGRLHSSARGGAPLPRAYGLQPLQYGVHGGHRRHDRRRDVQGVRLRARPCLHLDKRGEQTSSPYFSASSSPRWSLWAGLSTGARSNVCRSF